jgi:hypothetical protein
LTVATAKAVRKKEEGRRKKEEGRRKKEEGRKPPYPQGERRKKEDRSWL